METASSLPCLQHPTDGPCPDSDASSPHLPTMFIQDPF